MRIKVLQKDDGKLLVNEEFSGLLALNGISSFDKIWNIPSEPVKKVVKQRGTERIFLKSPGSAPLEAYIKRYRPEPLKEKIKNILSFRPNRYPGALNEWNAVVEFHRNNLPTMLPIACASKDGDSCILILGIAGYRRASSLFAEFSGKDRIRRRRLIGKIAELAAGMHSAGMAHQDFYLVHMFVRENEDDKIYLIDLQRVVFKEDFSDRWRVKDLAQLLFSSGKFASRTDMMYFWKIYGGASGGKMLRDKALITKIMRKAASIRKHAG
ncbi:MAG: lipopolysaccharide kinase InaA family protein [Victivallales bacterium]